MPLDRLVRNFLYVLSDHRRLPLLPEIAEISRVVFDGRQGVLRANIAAAEPLSDHDQKQLAEALGVVTGKQIRIEMTIDPSLIGGIIARVGSTVYDGSVRGRLHWIGERLASESR
jgi:F-type H+-transporting ATPase subunit delta